MKKLLCALLTGAAALGMTACGGEKEVQGAAVATMEQDGVTVTMTFDAKGDTVTRITQESTIDLEGFTEEQIEAVTTTVESAEDIYNDLEGVEYSCEERDGQLVEQIVIPTEGDTLKAVIEQGLLPVDNENLTQLSLKATTENLESAGWTIE